MPPTPRDARPVAFAVGAVSPRLSPLIRSSAQVNIDVARGIAASLRPLALGLSPRDDSPVNAEIAMASPAPKFARSSGPVNVSPFSNAPLPVHDFTITEIPAPGLKRKPIQFVWNRRERNIPRQPWTFGIDQRTVRTDYPGADDPTEQVLGCNYTPFTLEGRWSDKFNIPGYAVDTWRQFETLVRQGNKVRLQFAEVFVEGLITNAEFDFRRSAEIGYKFTFSPHHRKPGGQFALRRSPRTALNARQLLEEVTAIRTAAAEIHARAPRLFATGTTFVDVEALLDAWDASLATIALTIDQRVVLPNFEPAAGLRRLASLFVELEFDAISLRTMLRDSPSNTGLYYETGVLVLDYDAWTRGLQAAARNMISSANQSASDLATRAAPNAIALYRPAAGEHAYSISTRFYGTPHNYRAILTRNGMAEATFTGDELLVIPEAAGR